MTGGSGRKERPGGARTARSTSPRVRAHYRKTSSGYVKVRGHYRQAQATRWAGASMAVLALVITLVGAALTAISADLFGPRRGTAHGPAVTATRTMTVTPEVTPPAPRATVTVTAGPEIHVVLPSSIAIAVDSSSGDQGDGGVGFITALTGFLTGVSAVMTGVAAWITARQRRAEKEDPA
ncbi:hypothetical protein ABGB17_08575 [Sphaerisporangium sp. B11E5]|uniref:hypothetical protein n=1 Tax=Sphaerisporangium sp. B11E5 TaxID=3153563 RepID=UPI00325E2EA9